MLLKEKYALYVKRPYPPFPSSMVLTSWASEEQHRPFLPTPFAEKNNFFCDDDWYFVKEDVEKGTQLVFQHWSDPKNFQHGKKLLRQRGKKLLQSTKKDLPTFCTAFEAYIPAMHLIWFCEKPIDEKVRSLLQEKVSLAEVERIINYLSRPLQDNYYRKEEYDLIKCKHLKAHVKKYEWILSRYGEKKPYTLEQAQEKKNNINAVEFFRQYLEKRKKSKKKLIMQRR